MYQAANQLDEAYSCYQKCLQIRKAVQGSNHPLTATTLMSLGALLSQKGAVTQAQQCFEKALSINKFTFGDNHPQVATLLGNKTA